MKSEDGPYDISCGEGDVIIEKTMCGGILTGTTVTPMEITVRSSVGEYYVTKIELEVIPNDRYEQNRQTVSLIDALSTSSP